MYPLCACSWLYRYSQGQWFSSLSVHQSCLKSFWFYRHGVGSESSACLTSSWDPEAASWRQTLRATALGHISWIPISRVESVIDFLILQDHFPGGSLMRAFQDSRESKKGELFAPLHLSWFMPKSQWQLCGSVAYAVIQAPELRRLSAFGTF